MAEIVGFLLVGHMGNAVVTIGACDESVPLVTHLSGSDKVAVAIVGAIRDATFDEEELPA
jgi:hypothetical protein